MKLYYYRHAHGVKNFGDDLNPWFFDRVLPGLLDDDAQSLLVGIGTLINERLPTARKTAFFGTGVGYFNASPSMLQSWHIYFLRGPLSAKLLGLDARKAISDGAMMIGRFVEPSSLKEHRYSFMPHVSHGMMGQRSIFEMLCRELNLHYIDPGDPPDKIIAAINASEILVTEALHGAIVADTLRVPWIPVHGHPRIHEFKWEDWSQSINLDYRPHRILPFWRLDADANWTTRLRYRIKPLIVSWQLRSILRRAKPLLSDDAHHRSLLDRMEEQSELLKSDIDNGLYRFSARE